MGKLRFPKLRKDKSVIFDTVAIETVIENDGSLIATDSLRGPKRDT